MVRLDWKIIQIKSYFEWSIWSSTLDPTANESSSDVESTVAWLFDFTEESVPAPEWSRDTQ